MIADRRSLIQKEAPADEEADIHYRMTIDKIRLRSNHEVLQIIYDPHLDQSVPVSRNHHSRHKWNQNSLSLTVL